MLMQLRITEKSNVFTFRRMFDPLVAICLDQTIFIHITSPHGRLRVCTGTPNYPTARKVSFKAIREQSDP